MSNLECSKKRADVQISDRFCPSRASRVTDRDRPVTTQGKMLVFDKSLTYLPLAGAYFKTAEGGATTRTPGWNSEKCDLAWCMWGMARGGGTGEAEGSRGGPGMHPEVPLGKYLHLTPPSPLAMWPPWEPASGAFGMHRPVRRGLSQFSREHGGWVPGSGCHRHPPQRVVTVLF